MSVNKEPTRVFISYSHDSPAHAEVVLRLADQLRADGLDATIDQYEVAPPEGWPRWMDRHLRGSDFVLVICTKTYLQRARGEEDPGIGNGVRWEAHMTYQQLYSFGARNDRFIPILLDGGNPEHIPEPLRGYAYYQLEQPWRLDAVGGYESLYRHLTAQPRIKKPMLGALASMPPRLPQSQGIGRTLDESTDVRSMPGAAPGLVAVVTEVVKVLRLLVSRRPESGGSVSGCPGLYRLFVAMENFIRKNDDFILALRRVPSTKNSLDALGTRYGELVKSFVELVEELERHSLHLQIFDPDIVSRLNTVLGAKHSRFRFWLEVLNQNGQRLASKKELYRLENLSVATGHYLFSDDYGAITDQLQQVGTVSLEDSHVVAELVHEAENRVSEFRSVHRQLANFIKANCSYADLFDHGA